MDNDGPVAATGMLLADTLPGGVFLSALEMSAGNCAEDGGTINCHIGDLARGGLVTATVVVTPLLHGTLDNEATVTGSEPDTPYNNSASASTMIGLWRLVDLPLALR